MRIYFFVLDERLVDSGSREVERPAFRILPAAAGLGGAKCFNIFQKKISSRKDAKTPRVFNFAPSSRRGPLRLGVTKSFKNFAKKVKSHAK
jgi:hypothetical protein